MEWPNHQSRNRSTSNDSDRIQLRQLHVGRKRVHIHRGTIIYDNSGHHEKQSVHVCSSKIILPSLVEAIVRRRLKKSHFRVAPMKSALVPSSSSILRSSLYLAVLSPLAGAPVLMKRLSCEVARWEMKVSSVSPDL